MSSFTSSKTLRLNTSGKTDAYYHSDPVFCVDRNTVRDIIRRLKESGKEKIRLCMHLSNHDQVQEMILALTDRSYTAPHMHPERSETFLVLEGEIDLIIFTPKGEVKERIRMSPYGGKHPFVVRMTPGNWHVIRSLTPYSVYYEILQGPFEGEISEHADFAPKDGEKEKGLEYLRKL